MASRPGWTVPGLKLSDLILAALWKLVSRPHFEVAIWAILAGQRGGRDLDSPLRAEAMSLREIDVAT